VGGVTDQFIDQLTDQFIDQFIDLIFNALRDTNQYYTRKANEFLNKMNTKGYVIVSSYRPEQCGLACSTGIGGIGIIFIDRMFFEDKLFPEELKEFIIAHELAHIVRSHVVPTLFTRALIQVNLDALGELIYRIFKSGGLLEAVLGMALLLSLLNALAELTKADAELIRTQELEADSLAVQLAGCESARYFIELLEILKKHGYDVSHVAVLGNTALKIEERLDNLKRLCRTS
jgi:Zn-dependent protease with chaperone function